MQQVRQNSHPSIRGSQYINQPSYDYISQSLDLDSLFPSNSSFCIPAKKLFLGVYWNLHVCLSIYPCVCPSVYLSMYKILVSFKVLAGVLGHI